MDSPPVDPGPPRQPLKDEPDLTTTEDVLAFIRRLAIESYTGEMSADEAHKIVKILMDLLSSMKSASPFDDPNVIGILERRMAGDD